LAVTQYDRWGTQHAHREQDSIALKWSDAQQGYIDSLQKKNTGCRWAISVIQKALDVSWDMWEQRNDI
jgi:hypothetical protein